MRPATIFLGQRRRGRQTRPCGVGGVRGGICAGFGFFFWQNSGERPLPKQQHRYFYKHQFCVYALYINITEIVQQEK